LHLFRGESVCPLLRVVLELLSLPYCLSGDLFGESRVRLDLVVVGECLATGLDAVGEDVRRGLVV
jgi:hypothetical protein